MDRATAEQLEFFSNQTLDQVDGKNPNVKLNDIYKPEELDHLYQYSNFTDDELEQYSTAWVKATGSSYIDEMENLRGKINTVPAPLDDPSVPEQITKHPAFSDGEIPTDPDEIERRIEEFNKLQDRGARNRYGIDPYAGKGYAAPIITNPSGVINTYRDRLELARAGIPYEEGAPLGERFSAFMIPRSDPVSAIRNIAEAKTGQKQQRNELGYELPNADHLYPGRPFGQQGPVIRYERNVETGEIESRFPFNEPGITGGDWVHYGLREAPAIAGDIAATLATSAVLKARIPYYKSIPTKLKEWGTFAAASGFGTAASDMARYSAGNAWGYNEGDFEDAMKEATLIGTYAAGGSAVATATMAGARGTWNFFTSKDAPDFIIERLRRLRQDFQTTLKQQGIEPGSPAARALFDDSIGRAPTEVQKVMKEVTGRDYISFLGENQIGPDADFALGMLNMMQREGFPADKTMELLHKQILNNKATRLLFAERLLLEGGSSEAAKESAANLGKALNDDLIPTQMNAAIDEQMVIYQNLIDEGVNAENILAGLGIDDVASLGLRQAEDGLPGTLGGETAVGENLLKLMPDAESNRALFTNPTITRLASMQRQYMAPIQKDIDTFMSNVGGLQRSLNISSPMAKEITNILGKGPKGTAPSILQKDAVLKEWLYRNIEGESTKKALLRLQGRSSSGAFGSDKISFKELHEFRLDLHNMRNQIGDKISDPARKSVNELIAAVEKQQNLFLKNAQKDPRLIENLTSDTIFTDSYWGLLSRYGDMSRVSNNKFVKTLLKTGMDNPAGLIDTLFNSGSKTSGNLYHPTGDALFKILRGATASYEGNVVSVFNPETVIADLQMGIASRYKRVISEAGEQERNIFKKNNARIIAHDKFMQQNKGLVDAAFDDPKGIKAWENMNSSMAYMNKVSEGRDKAIEKIRKEFGEIIPDGNPDEAILKILRGEGLENASAAMRKRLKLAEIIKDSGDPNMIRRMNRIALKDIYSQITVLDTAAGGGLGLKTIDFDALNRLLTKDFVVGGNTDEVISFTNLYSPFLDGKQLNHLKILNASVQNEKRRLSTGEGMVQAAMALGRQGETPPAKLGRFIFGPLNKYTYRIGQRGNTLEEKTSRLMQEAVLKPEILDQLAEQMNKKQDINQMIRFFYSLDSVIANDIGRDLEEAQEYYDENSFSDRYGEEANQDMFGSEEYFNFFQEVFTPPSAKSRGRRPGIIPGREQVEYGPITVPAGAASIIGSAYKGLTQGSDASDVGSIVEVTP